MQIKSKCGIRNERKFGAFTFSHNSSRDLNLLSLVFSGSFDYQTSLLQADSVKYRLQNVDCRPGVKCRLRVKCRLQTVEFLTESGYHFHY